MIINLDIILKALGKEHIISLIIFLILGLFVLIFSKLKIKTHKTELIYFRILSIFIIISNLLCRIGEGIQYGFINSIPSSICAVTGFVLPLIILFGKKNLGVYQGLIYLGTIGGLFALILAPFISQGPTIFQLNTFMALVYHWLLLILCISMILFNWFKPEIKRSFYFPVVYSSYIAFGAFEYFVLEIGNPMSIRYPLIDNTPFTCWFILLVGTILVYLIAFIYEFTIKLINKKKNKYDNNI